MINYNYYFCPSNQENLGHASVESTMIYTHALERGPSRVTSRPDRPV